jgi:hypothetical protein
MKDFLSTNLNAVFIIGPVDQKTAPYHAKEDGKVEPVKPAYSKWMFFDYSFDLA